MKAKYLLSAGIIASGMLFTACNDKLDIDKKGNLGDPTTYYNTEDRAEAAIAAAYAVTNFNMVNFYDFLNQLSDDEYTGGGSSTDFNDYQLVNAYAFGADNALVKSNYTWLYTLIYDANLVISYVDPNMGPKAKQAVAEAYFFRGMAHLYLGALWGNAPVVTELLEPTACQVPNTPRTEVYAQAINDLKAAVSGGLPEKANATDIQKRVTKQAAQAYLGKAYLFAQQYAEAASVLDEVIKSGKYTLEPLANYKNIQNNGTADSPETIWGRYLDPSSTLPQSDWNSVQGTMNYFQDRLNRGWRNDGFYWDGNKDLGYEAVYGNKDSELGDSQSGYALGNPRGSLYTAMKEHETKLGADLTRLNSTIATYEWMEKQGLHMVTTYEQFGNDGYWNMKLRFMNNEIVGHYGNGGWNVWINNQHKYMRYAEVLLMAAEANIQAGNAEIGTKYLNEVRERAGEALASTATLQDVKDEKRFELCFEACRYMDLQRWGDAATVLANQGKQVPSFNGKTINPSAATHENGGYKTGRDELLPFPTTELIVNPNIEQNIGW